DGGKIARLFGVAMSARPSCSTIARVRASSRSASMPPARPRWSRSRAARASGSRSLNRENRSEGPVDPAENEPDAGVSDIPTPPGSTYPVDMARSHLTLAALATSAVAGLDVVGAQPFGAPGGDFDSALLTGRDGRH